MSQPQDLTTFLNSLPLEQQQALFQQLRQRFIIHSLEQQWNISAEFILEAISQSQDITKRGVRGIIAELCFNTYVLGAMQQRGWVHHPQVGDLPYDALISHPNVGQIKIQTKNQRLERGEPKFANGPMIRFNPMVDGWFVCETQKTRTGKDADGQDTRPYRYGEFDILSVCLHPSSGDWRRFMFCPAHTLIPRADNPELIAVLQPVSPIRQGNWTDNLEEAIQWHLEKRIFNHANQNSLI